MSGGGLAGAVVVGVDGVDEEVVLDSIGSRCCCGNKFDISISVPLIPPVKR